MDSSFSLKIKDKTGIYESLVKSLLKEKSISVKVGFLSGIEPYIKYDKDGKVIVTQVVDVAIWNEFGIGNIPSRPFFRLAWNANKKRYKDLILKFLKLTINGTVHVRPSIFFGALGASAATDVKKSIINLTTPPNAPLTIKLKGFDNPLIETGHMVSSVTWEVGK